MLGVLAGFVGEIALCVAGAGALLFRHESARIALTVLASGYMLWLAVRLWRAPAGAASTAAGDLAPSLWRFAVLQFVNPKSWLATLAFVAGFLGPRNPLGPLGDLLAVAVFLGVISVSMCVWTVFGAALRACLQSRHWHRVNRTLAVLAAATSITFWL
jgi:threonine/homoserine/homoserine lactone efflux protein